MREATIQCPNCHDTIHIPYIPALKEEGTQEQNLNVWECLIGVQYAQGALSLEEYLRLSNEINNWRDLLTYERVKKIMEVR